MSRDILAFTGAACSRDYSKNNHFSYPVPDCSVHTVDARQLIQSAQYLHSYSYLDIPYSYLGIHCSYLAVASDKAREGVARYLRIQMDCTPTRDKIIFLISGLVFLYSL